jgi:monofunctional biosynthetic peptidoglycan transglycosylase
MSLKTPFAILICFLGILTAPCRTARAEQTSLQIETSSVVYDFDNPESAKTWQIVNDGVMGGRSNSSLTIAEDGIASFTGVLSLENKGGFASVRSKPANLELKLEQEVVLRVRGDGRRYTFNLYDAQRRMAFSYQADFETVKDQWTEVHLPLAQFVAKTFGQRDDGNVLDPTQVNSVGILIGDKLAGPFELKIDWIKVEVPSQKLSAN